MSAQLVGKYFTKQNICGHKGMCYYAGSTAFERECGGIVGTADAGFPNKIVYEFSCGDLCRSRTPQNVLLAQKNLIMRLDAVAKARSATNKHVTAACAELVFMFEVFAEVGDDAEPIQIVYSALASASGAWFRFPATQTV